MVRFVHDGDYLVIFPSCSSLANMSLAFLCWITISEWVGHHRSVRDLGWCLLACGSVIVINVGRISLTFTDLVTNVGRPAAHVVAPRPIPVARGGELGAYNLGSTVVLLVADPGLVPAVAEGRLVRMGEALWRKA